jgi:hypothetical protein
MIRSRIVYLPNTRLGNRIVRKPNLARVTKPAADGPGAELKKLLAWFAEPSTACECGDHAAQMNAWGVEGCRANLETITDWLLDAAEQRGWPSGPLSRWAARRLVLVAIARAKRER